MSNNGKKNSYRARMRTIRTAVIAVGILIVILIGLAVAEHFDLTKQTQNNVPSGTENPLATATSGESAANPYREAPYPIATLAMQDGSMIKIELYPDIAPNTVANFISLANSGYYDGLIFHRVIPGFMIQGGCPQGTGRGNPGYSIRGEFAANGFENNLPHERGVISMARSNHPDSAGSQFFIMHEESPHLNSSYAAFGRVIEGIEVVDKIAAVQTDYADKPLSPQVIQSITVDTMGVEYTVNKIGG